MLRVVLVATSTALSGRCWLLRVVDVHRAEWKMLAVTSGMEFAICSVFSATSDADGNQYYCYFF